MVKKVDMVYIENDSSRKQTYKKRVRGLVKKTQELSTLCGVDACAIVYGQDAHAPVVWPASDAEVKRIALDYMNNPEVDLYQRNFSQKTYLDESIKKAQASLQKVQRKNRDIQMENLVSEIISGRSTLTQVPPSDFKDLLWVIDDKLMNVKNRIKVIEEGKVNNHPLPTKNPSPSPNANNGANPVVDMDLDFDDVFMEGIDEFIRQTWGIEAGSSSQNM